MLNEMKMRTMMKATENESRVRDEEEGSWVCCCLRMQVDGCGWNAQERHTANPDLIGSNSKSDAILKPGGSSPAQV